MVSVVPDVAVVGIRLVKTASVIMRCSVFELDNNAKVTTNANVIVEIKIAFCDRVTAIHVVLEARREYLGAFLARKNADDVAVLINMLGHDIDLAHNCASIDAAGSGIGRSDHLALVFWNA